MWLVCMCSVFFGYRGSNGVMPSLSRDLKWPRLTKFTHSRVVGLRLQGKVVVVVIIIIIITIIIMYFLECYLVESGLTNRNTWATLHCRSLENKQRWEKHLD